jgi:hypothetical protein
MPNRSSTAELKDKMSALAERIALEGFKIKLDYSVESIKQVESILAKLHKDYKRTRSEDGLQGIALEFGAYIVKVIEKHFGSVTWERDHPSIGQDTFPLQWRGTTLFPFGWCMKRILDGPGDDVWFKFHALILKHNDKPENSGR